jgi:hypothetical protein
MWGLSGGEMEFVVIGSVPAAETIPSAPPDDERLAKKAAEVFARQVVRHLGPAPVGVEIAVERVADAESTIYCAVCYYDETSEAAFDYAWRCSTEPPAQWDDVARAELASARE